MDRSSDTPEGLWAQIVAIASPMTRGALQAGRPASLERNVLTVTYAPGLDIQFTIVDTDRVRRGIEAKFAEMGRPLTLRFARGGTPPDGYTAPSAPGPTPSPPSENPRPASPTAGPGNAAAKAKPEKVVPIKLDPVEFKNDPLIKEAMELFKGQLVEVRRAEEPGNGA